MNLISMLYSKEKRTLWGSVYNIVQITRFVVLYNYSIKFFFYNYTHVKSQCSIWLHAPAKAVVTHLWKKIMNNLQRHNYEVANVSKDPCLGNKQELDVSS